MYEPFLDYARQQNNELVKRIALEKQLKTLKSPKSRLWDRFLLRTSDLLLAAGEKIRPQENQVYNEVTINKCHTYADLT
jgi:hypothetical protein